MCVVRQKSDEVLLAIGHRDYVHCFIHSHGNEKALYDKFNTTQARFGLRA